MLSWSTRVGRFEHSALPHLPAVYRMARQMVDDEAAQDLVKETSLREFPTIALASHSPKRGDSNLGSTLFS